ncbi:MAG: hypothetical protein EZS28_038457 [Streblomastix strix]|uniref:Uncharacterized protein n=1 Tax=Streblomastix strix TaxID=222440 RepID=A0A5J4U5B5_9EUKA|nr:MAG: hypothetical protein EZS28_038457 [Streblomastix strix]
MGKTTLQKISTRSNRPNDPITRIRKDTKLTSVPPPELLRQQTRIVIAPSLILAVILENMDAYIDATQNCMNILLQFASHTQIYQDDLIVDSKENGANDTALNTLYLLCFICEMQPLYTLQILAQFEASVDKFSDGTNNSLQAQKLVTILDSYNHTHVGGREVTPSERQGAMANCMGLLVFNIDNDVNITTAFPTNEAAPTAMTGMKHQYTSQDTLLHTKPINSLLVGSLVQSQTHNRLQLF